MKAIAVIISGFGALNGWTMICAEKPLLAARDGLFPARFKTMSGSGVPAFGIIAATTLASIAMIVNYLGSSGDTVFTTLVLMTRITSAIPYGFSAPAQIKSPEKFEPWDVKPCRVLGFLADVAVLPLRRPRITTTRAEKPSTEEGLIVGVVPTSAQRRLCWHLGCADVGADSLTRQGLCVHEVGTIHASLWLTSDVQPELGART
jgi:amino acid transporter